MAKHVNIPIFIPHLGCPNQCVFCNQRHISGVTNFDPNSVVDIIENSLKTIDAECETEIAFFGGSFTGIDPHLMINLLEIANRYINQGRVSSIRCSTRPDYINSDILDVLERYRVKVIELGMQSADDSVLALTKRGHTREDILTASKLIVSRGFQLVGQIMIGLPGSTPETELNTAKLVVECGASAARIYPTIVFRDTELSDMCISGVYEPLTEKDAVKRSATVLAYFIDNGIDVIRIGLCSSENLKSEESYFRGPNHPALGELVISEYYFDAIYKLLSSKQCKNKIPIVYVSRGALSKAIGQHRINKNRLIRELGLADIKFKEHDELRAYELKSEFEEDT
ncbi:MAG: radical SAM protein [Clostridia bacterium]|nr:radical SAM protein [Clostridia bacterium]